MKLVYPLTTIIFFVTSCVSNKNEQTGSSDNLSKRWKDVATKMPEEWYFSSLDGIKKSSLAEISNERRNGSWYTTAPAKVLTRYPEWKEKNKIN